MGFQDDRDTSKPPSLGARGVNMNGELPPELFSISRWNSKIMIDN